MGKWPDIRADRKWNSRGNLFFEFLYLVLEHRALAPRPGFRLVHEVLEDCKGRHRGYVLGLHDSHGFVAQLRRMIDGRDARLLGVHPPRFPPRLTPPITPYPCAH